ncbi:TonB family protein [Fusobacterium varium]|uniref:energy transducer TonB n=1 Tax=Fusobacterium varium TaxID=856 RepID=UPI0035649811
MKRYFIIALLLHGILFLQLSLPTVTKDLDNKENLLKQSVPVTFTQVSNAAPVAAAAPQPVAETPKPKEIPKKEIPKSEVPKPVPKKTIPKKTEPKKETTKEPETEIKETPKVAETTASGNSGHSSSGASMPGIDSLFTANADGTYNAVSNHGIKYKIVKEITPAYPKQAENIRYRKKVMVKAKFLVDQSGNVKNISIINSHSKLGFDQAVIDALGKWKFSPIVYNGKVISVYFQKEFIFEPKS